MSYVDVAVAIPTANKEIDQQHAEATTIPMHTDDREIIGWRRLCATGDWER